VVYLLQRILNDYGVQLIILMEDEGIKTPQEKLVTDMIALIALLLRPGLWPSCSCPQSPVTSAFPLSDTSNYLRNLLLHHIIEIGNHS